LKILFDINNINKMISSIKEAEKTGQTDFMKLFEECRLCPRNCGINRINTGKSSRGFCGQGHILRAAYIGAHFGEEPPITGARGSGTIFFSGCPLKCSFCQNYQISRDGLGKVLDTDELLHRVITMIREKGVHNINFVTPDHYFPYVIKLVELLRDRGYLIPTVFNLSGYQSTAMLGMAEDYADIYLPDFKYSDRNLSKRLSNCGDYPKVAIEAITEMVRQKGFLDSFNNDSGLAGKGILVRHLILPGNIENSLNALTTLFLEFGADLPVSLMSQYQPVISHEDGDMNRPITREEFDKVYSHANDLGFNNLFVQFPDEMPGRSQDRSPFLPDFHYDEPFTGNAPNPS
jgi:putative pyruvate formate lyase activating enzyme